MAHVSTQPQRSAQQSTSFGTLQIGIIVLTLATALIHLYRAVAIGAPSLRMFPLVFYLNFLGYVVLLAALYLPQLLAYRRAIRWTLIGYTVLTIVLYFVMAGLRFNPVGLVDKLIEVVLVALLYLEDRATS